MHRGLPKQSYFHVYYTSVFIVKTLKFECINIDGMIILFPKQDHHIWCLHLPCFEINCKESNTPFKPNEFQRVQSGAPVEVLRSESNFFFIPGESPIEPDELLSKSYPPRTLLANQKFIGFQR